MHQREPVGKGLQDRGRQAFAATGAEEHVGRLVQVGHALHFPNRPKPGQRLPIRPLGNELPHLLGAAGHERKPAAFLDERPHGVDGHIQALAERRPGEHEEDLLAGKDSQARANFGRRSARGHGQFEVDAVEHQPGIGGREARGAKVGQHPFGTRDGADCRAKRRYLIKSLSRRKPVLGMRISEWACQTTPIFLPRRRSNRLAAQAAMS